MDTNLTKEQMILFNKYVDEARELYGGSDFNDYFIQFLCYKLVVDGNIDLTDDKDVIERNRARYVN